MNYLYKIQLNNKINSPNSKAGCFKYNNKFYRIFSNIDNNELISKLDNNVIILFIYLVIKYSKK